MNEKWFYRAFGIVAASFLALFLIYPILIILSQSFTDRAEFFDVLQNPFYYRRLAFTTGQALASTILTVLIALPSAVLFSRFEFLGKRLLRSLFLIPFVMPTVVVAIGFMTIVGANGIIPIDLRNSLWIILLAHVFYNYAIVVRIVSSYLEKNASKAYEAAKMLRANRWKTLFQVTLPLASPAILAAATLVFIFCFTSFGVILILAPAPDFATLELEIYKLSSKLLLLAGAAYLALLQLVIIFVFTLIYTKLQARASIAFKASQVPLRRAKGFTLFFLNLHFLIVAFVLLSPLIALVVKTFWQGSGFSLDAFVYAAESKRTIGFTSLGKAIMNSLRLALLSMTVALSIGFAFAYATVRAGWTWLDQASLLPLSISAVTLGLGYLIAFPALRTSIWGVTLAHSLIAFPFVTRSLLPALRSLPVNIFNAAKTLGASPYRILRQVELPLLRPAFITAASFAFAISMGEFAATLTLQNSRFATLPVAIFDRLSRPGMQNYSAALALACLLMLFTGLIIFLLERSGETEF